MTTLTLNSTQSIRLGDDVLITVLSAANGKIRLHIDAPASLPVIREDVYQRNHVAEGFEVFSGS